MCVYKQNVHKKDNWKSETEWIFFTKLYNFHAVNCTPKSDKLIHSPARSHASLSCREMCSWFPETACRERAHSSPWCSSTWWDSSCQTSLQAQQTFTTTHQTGTSAGTETLHFKHTCIFTTCQWWPSLWYQHNTFDRYTMQKIQEKRNTCKKQMGVGNRLWWAGHIQRMGKEINTQKEKERAFSSDCITWATN